MLWRRLGRAGAVGSMRAPTWHFEAAWEGERGGSGGEWRAAERGTRVRDWGGGGGAGGLGSVDGGALEGSYGSTWVWRRQTTSAWSAGRSGSTPPRSSAATSTYSPASGPPRPPSHSDWLRVGREPGYV